MTERTNAAHGLGNGCRMERVDPRSQAIGAGCLALPSALALATLVLTISKDGKVYSRVT